MARRTPFLIAVSSLALLGCTSLGAGVPVASTAQQLSPTGTSPWREDFGDPALRALLRRADLASLDVKAALNRLAYTNAQVQIARATQSPQVGIGAGGAVGDDTSVNLRARAAPYVSATYELDLWGRIERGVKASQADRLSAVSDVEAARLLLGAEVARSFLNLRASEAILRSQWVRRGSMDQVIKLTEARRREGKISGEDAAARRQALHDLDIEITNVQLTSELARIKISALLGSRDRFTPSVGSGDWPQVGPTPKISSDQVDQRPDVMAAYHRLEAADHRRAETVAATRPRFTLSLSAGAADPSVVNLLDARSLIWAAAADISYAFSDGGAKTGRIKAAEAEADLADLAYRATVVRAWSEAQSALRQADAAEADLELEQANLLAARRSLKRVQSRHQAGLTNGIDLSIAEEQAQRGEIAMINAQFKVCSSRIDLALAAPQL